MGSITAELTGGNFIKPPPFVPNSVQYEVITGSFAYGMSGDDSDRDIYGFCMPPKSVIFPHLEGFIPHFGTPPPNFEQYVQHHVDAFGKQHDLTIFSIVKFFDLCLWANPNMIDTLFVPQRCVTFQTKIGQHVRENRKLFLHKGAFQKFKGYAYSQLKKIKTKDPKAGSKRRELVEKFGFDTKMASHVVRLLEECRQILVEGDLDLERNSEQLKSIRRGDWTLQQVEDWFASNEKGLEEVYANSKLPWGPEEETIKRILLNCLEEYYGDLSKVVIIPSAAEEKLKKIQAVLNSP